LLADVIACLHLDSSTKAPISVAASHHGNLRRKQGYSVAMVMEESRRLPVCLLTTLHKNTRHLDYDEICAQCRRVRLACAHWSMGAVGGLPASEPGWTLVCRQFASVNVSALQFAAKDFCLAFALP
jgi:hypothetical protein